MFFYFTWYIVLILVFFAMLWKNNKSSKRDPEVEALVKEAEQQVAAPKDISEPIYSFVRTMKENPRRFRFIEQFGFGKAVSRSSYELKDKITGEIFKAFIEADYWKRDEYTWSYPKFLTKDEFDYIKIAVGEICKWKKDRISEYKQSRVVITRNKLAKIYCTFDEEK